jgi:hypothetical protein
MGHTVAVWRVLEALLLALRKNGVQVSSEVIEDLRAARSMIDLSYREDASETAAAKAEMYTANVEACLISQAQEVFEPAIVDEWLARLKEASLQQAADKNEVSEDNTSGGRFVFGVPRDQKWLRIETDSSLSEEYVLKSAEKWCLTVNKQADGRLMVSGTIDDVKAFVKQITVKSV